MTRSDDTPPNPLNIALKSQRESAEAIADAVEKTTASPEQLQTLMNVEVGEAVVFSTASATASALSR